MIFVATLANSEFPIYNVLMRKIILTAAALFCGLCFAQEAPSWLASPETEFPSEQYASAAGEGETDRAARMDAMIKIARSFKTTLQDVSKAARKAAAFLSDGSVDFSSNETLAQMAGSKSSMRFFNAKFTEIWHEKSGNGEKSRVLAYIDKSETAELYKSRIEALGDAAGLVLAAAKKQAEPFAARAILKNGKALESLADLYEKALAAVAPRDDGEASAEFEEAKRSFSKIDAALLDLKKELTVSIKIKQKDKKFAPILQTISDIVEKKGFSISSAKPRYKMEIDVSYSEEELDFGGPFVRTAIKATITNKTGSDVFLYEKEYPRSGGNTTEEAYSRALSKIQEDLEQNFFAE